MSEPTKTTMQLTTAVRNIFSDKAEQIIAAAKAIAERKTEPEV